MIDKNELKLSAIEAGKIRATYGAGIPHREKFRGLATPTAILSLLSEIEGLHAQHGRDIADLRNLCQARDDARKERDQLKAENEALRHELSALKPVQISTDKTTIGSTGCLVCGKYTDHGGLQCPNLAARSLHAENQRIVPVDPIRVSHPLESAMSKGDKA